MGSIPSADMVLRLADQLDVPFFAEVAPDLLRPPINLVRLGLDARGFARLIANLEDVRAVFRSRITRQLATAPDSELAQLYDELPAPDSDDATSQPIESDVVIPMIVRLAGRDLRLFSTTTTFGTATDITLAEVAIESYYPADADSAAFFMSSDGGSQAEIPGRDSLRPCPAAAPIAHIPGAPRRGPLRARLRETARRVPRSGSVLPESAMCRDRTYRSRRRRRGSPNCGSTKASWRPTQGPIGVVGTRREQGGPRDPGAAAAPIVADGRLDPSPQSPAAASH